jgi:hypothetical protein
MIEEEPYRDGEWARQVRPARPGEGSNLRGVDIGTLLRESGYPTISLLKIDIEGAEGVLFAKNYEKWLDEVDTIVIELHDDSRFGEVGAIFERAVAGRGFALGRSGELTVARRRPE